MCPNLDIKTIHVIKPWHAANYPKPRLWQIGYYEFEMSIFTVHVKTSLIEIITHLTNRSHENC